MYVCITNGNFAKIGFDTAVIETSKFGKLWQFLVNFANLPTQIQSTVVELGQGAELALQAYKAVITFLGISVLQIRFLNNVSSVEER